VGETAASRYTAFSINDDGSLDQRRVLFQLTPEPPMGSFGEMISQLQFAPDGCCLDAEGALWIADAIGQRLIRVREGGQIVDEIAVGTGVYACMLGGADGRTLFACAAPDFDENARAAARDGRLLSVRVDIPHAVLP